jgi:hypothetical protein
MMALTGYQMLLVKQAAALLPTHARDSFLQSVAGRLADLDHITDADMANAVTFVLSTRGVAAAPAKRR